MPTNRTVITVDQLKDPHVRVEHTTTHPEPRVCIFNDHIELHGTFAEFREWLGAAGLELGQAMLDVHAGYRDEPASPMSEAI